MAKTYRVGWLVRLGNRFTTACLCAGVPLGSMVLLTVRGRTSGAPRTTPVTLVAYAGRRYLVAPYGAVNWVRNLRAAGHATLVRGRHVERITVEELSAVAAAPVLKHSLTTAAWFIRQYFDVTPASSLADVAREAPRHPVFVIQLGLERPSMPRVRSADVVEELP